MKKTLRLALGAAALAAVAWGVRLHFVEAPAWQPAAARPITGVVHVHSSASHDSSTSLAAIVAEAKQLGRDFVIVTDHDAHTQPPALDERLVVLRETELSTPAGHLMALRSRPRDALEVRLADDSTYDDGPQPSDLTRELRDIAAAQRFGLWPVVAHPSEAKSPWRSGLPQRGGVEVLNAAAQLRQVAQPYGLGLLPVAAAALLRFDALGWALYAAPNEAIARWDAAASSALVGLCGVDSHGWLPLRHELTYWTVMLEDDVDWPSEPRERPAAVLDALVRGRFSCVANLGGAMPHFALQHLPAKGAEAARIHVTLDDERRGADGFALRLLRDGVEIARGRPPQLEAAATPGLYRAEVWADLPRLVWGTHPARVLLSQRLVVGAAEEQK